MVSEMAEASYQSLSSPREATPGDAVETYRNTLSAGLEAHGNLLRNAQRDGYLLGDVVTLTKATPTLAPDVFVIRASADIIGRREAVR